MTQQIFYYEIDDEDSRSEKKVSDNHFPDDGVNQRHWLFDSALKAVMFMSEHYGDHLMVVYDENFHILYERAK